ncbi:MAG: GDSL-type esterase/lipase family protein [Desulfobacteraceae bacterium]
MKTKITLVLIPMLIMFLLVVGCRNTENDTPSPDQEAPSVPADLSVTEQGHDSISLAWSASTDNIGVIGYRIYRDAVELETSAGPFFTDSGLTPETSYTYSVSAYDLAGNQSEKSSELTAATTAHTPGPDPDPSAYTRYPNGRVHSPITQNVADTIRGIYNDGASTGRQADRFVKVGDSISTGSYFLSSNADVDYEEGVTNSWEYCRNLDSYYSDLSPTIEHFLAQVPGSTNMNATEQERKLVSHVTSWDRASQSTIVSYTCPGLYDYMVDEMSEVNSAYSVIMCGANDVGGLGQWQSFEETVDLFAENVTALIDLSIRNNVIPLVRSTPTQTQASDYAQERQDALDTMNHLLRAIAQSRQIPFADMYSVFEDLPDYGLSDGVHFNSGGYNRAAWYDEANLAYGTSNQNLIVTTQLDRALEVTFIGTSFLDSQPAGYSGSGTSGDPIIIDELPFIDARTSTESVYYRLDLGAATDIRVMMAEPSDDDYQVVVDSESPDDQMFEGNLEASSHFIEIRPVNAGEYWLVIQEYGAATSAQRHDK